MRLHDSTLAPNARRVRIFLAEKGLSVPTVQLDLARLEHKTEAYSVLNPFQTVPALELDDGEVISESVAICRYFEELHPKPPLFGVGALERARVEMWHRRLEMQLFHTIAQTYRHTHPAAKVLEPRQIPDWAELNRGRALRHDGCRRSAVREPIHRRRSVQYRRYNGAGRSRFCQTGADCDS